MFHFISVSVQSYQKFSSETELKLSNSIYIQVLPLDLIAFQRLDCWAVHSFWQRSKCFHCMFFVKFNESVTYKCVTIQSIFAKKLHDDDQLEHFHIQILCYVHDCNGNNNRLPRMMMTMVIMIVMMTFYGVIQNAFVYCYFVCLPVCSYSYIYTNGQ